MEMLEKGLVSVVIPACGCAPVISQALDSALQQDVPVEIIVINDCSPDDLDEVVAAYGSDVRYVKNEKNLGAASSRNLGVSMARGEYVAFLDADDYWAPEKLKKQLTAMDASGAVLCATGREMMTQEGVCTGHVIPVKSEITYQQLLRHNSINCSSVVIRTEVAREFPMEREDSHEDYIMWLKVLKKYGTACGVNEPLLKYRSSASGKSGSKWKSARMTWKVYRHMDFGILRSLLCFCSYTVHGVWKHYLHR